MCLSLWGSVLEMGRLTSRIGQLTILTLSLSPSMLFINRGYLLCSVPRARAFFSPTFCTFVRIWLWSQASSSDAPHGLAGEAL